MLEQERALLKAAPAPTTMDDMLSLEDILLDDDIVKLNALLQGVGYSMVVDDRTITVAESSVFSESDVQTYKYLGSDCVNLLNYTRCTLPVSWVRRGYLKPS